MTLPSVSTVFWIIAVSMVIVALAFALPALMFHRARPAAPSRFIANAAVYRSRIAELDREIAAGTRNDAERARAELEQRMLADTDDDGHPANLLPAPRLAFALSIALPLSALCLYATFGDPDAVTANAGIVAPGADTIPPSRDDLVRHLARSPRDGRGWVLLARMDFASERYADAAAAFENAIASPKVATDPAVWCEYADALGMAQGGTLLGRPRELVMRALTLDPAHPKALEMAGSAAFEAREYGIAVKLWRELLALLPARSRSHDELATAIARAEALAQRDEISARPPPTVR